MTPLSRVLALSAFLLLPAEARCQADSARSVPIAPLMRIPSSEWGADVIVIDSAEIARSTAATFSELLEARRPGVRVLRQGGTASDGALVLLRGPTSLSATKEPVLIVDGVRVDSRQDDQPIGTTSVAPSRLDDLFPEDIERIEVLSGPAAALYGEGASNGVIVVTTKSGGVGPLHWGGRATWDAAITRDDFPANYHRTGISPSTGQPASQCLLFEIADGQCTPTGLDVWNPLAQASPFRVGNSGRGHIELGGTTLGTTLFAGVTGEQRQGTLPRDERSRLGLRGKLSRVLPWHFGIEANGAWLRENARLAVDGNAELTSNVLANGLTGVAEDDANRGYAPGVAFSGDSIYPSDVLRHATGAVSLTWQPLSWLDARFITGRDRVAERWRQEQLGPSFTSAFPDARVFEEYDLRSAAGHVSATYKLGPRIAATSGVGLERLARRWATYDTSNGNGPLLFGFSQLRFRSTSLALDEHVAIGEHVFGTVALERATNNIFGFDNGKEWFPSANISWLPPMRTRGIGNVRFHAAYAEAPGALMSPGLPTGAVPFTTSASPPKMERTKSLELGADATLGGATQINLTVFDSRSTRLWETSLASGGLGYGVFGQNGAISNTGLEAFVSAPLLYRSEFRWTGSLSLALFRNRVTGLMGTPPVEGVNGPYGRGYAYGGVWAQPYTYADSNGDGIISLNELTRKSLAYIGTALPTLESALSTDLQMRGGIDVSGTFDYRTGNRVVDRTAAVRCGLVANCRALQDPSSSLADQAAGLGGLQGGGFAEDGSFMKVREIAVHWTIPRRWASVVGTHTALSFAGRNLAMWTRYRGLDPEISFAPPDVLPREEYMGMPLPREFIVRLDIGSREPSSTPSVR